MTNTTSKGTHRARRYSLIFSFLSIGALISTNTHASAAQGTLKVANRSGCNIVLDSDSSKGDKSAAVAEFKEQTIKPGKTGKAIKYSFDIVAYAELKIEAGASCEAQGSASVGTSFWSIITSQGIKGKFNAKASCDAAIHAVGTAGTGISPYAFITIPGYTVDNDGKKIADFQLLLNRVSNSGITISSLGFSDGQSCGLDEGFYAFSGAKDLAYKRKFLSLKKRFKNYTTTVSLGASNELVTKSATTEFAKSPISKDNPSKGEFNFNAQPFGHHRAFPELEVSNAYQLPDLTQYSAEIKGFIKLIQPASKVPTLVSISEAVSLAKFSDFSKLRICYLGNGMAIEGSSYAIYPTKKHPDNSMCAN